MIDHELATYLATRLQQLPDTELVLKTAQIIAVIGVEETERLAISTVTLTTDTRPRMKKRSAIPLHKRFLHEGYSRFNRLDLLAAIEAARINSYISPNSRGTPIRGNGVQPRDMSRTPKTAD